MCKEWIKWHTEVMKAFFAFPSWIVWVQSAFNRISVTLFYLKHNVTPVDFCGGHLKR